MNFRNLHNILAPLVAIAAPVLLAGCDGASVEINGEQGKKLAELDLSGAPPHQVVVLGPDTVNITSGAKLAITVEGEGADQLRFTLKDGTLAVLREGKLWTGPSKAVVHVTMPAPDELVMTGSGRINAGALAAKAKVSILGSGDVATTQVASERLEANIIGSGSYRASGSAAELKLTIMGSGNADMAALKAGGAKVSIVGSGSGAFASDGTVKASIMGSGSVKVAGRASCTVSAMGSGKLVCEPGNGPVVHTEGHDDDEDKAEDAAEKAADAADKAADKTN